MYDLSITFFGNSNRHLCGIDSGSVVALDRPLESTSACARLRLDEFLSQYF